MIGLLRSRVFVVIIIAAACAQASGQSVRYNNYKLRPTDPGHAEALKIGERFLQLTQLPKQHLGGSEATAEVSKIHGATRPLWRVHYGSGVLLKIDMGTRHVVSFHDFGREEAQFRGTQPMQRPRIRTQPEAKATLLRLARRMGIPESSVPDSFTFKVKPGEPRYAAGRAGMTFKSATGERIAGISIDLLDGGVNGCWFAAWKVVQDVAAKRRGSS